MWRKWVPERYMHLKMRLLCCSLTKRGLWLSLLFCECDPWFTHLLSVSWVPPCMRCCPQAVFKMNIFFLDLEKLQMSFFYKLFLTLNFKHTHKIRQLHCGLWEGWMEEIVAAGKDFNVFPNCCIYKMCIPPNCYKDIFFPPPQFRGKKTPKTFHADWRETVMWMLICPFQGLISSLV